MKKYIFLDFDGVLNSRAYLDATPMDDEGRCEEKELDPEAIARINRLIEQTAAVVVVSSAWRYGRSKKSLQALLRSRGFKGMVVDVTPDQSPNERHTEIQAWLEYNDCTAASYVIIDDDSDAANGDEMMKRFINTSFQTGLLDEHIEQAITILNGEIDD